MINRLAAFALCIFFGRLSFAQCGGPITYCAPTTASPLPIPAPPNIATTDPYTGAGVMFTTPWSNLPAMRVTDGKTNHAGTSFGLFEATQSNPAVRSPMLGLRASPNCNNSSPTCYYIRVIGGTTRILWIDGGSNPLSGNWKVGQVCADNPNYSETNGYTLGPAYDYGATASNFWHTPKFLQTPGSEGILIDVELRTAAGSRNGNVTGDDAWLIARDMTTCSSTADVPETPVVDFSQLYPAYDPTHTRETQGYGPAFSEGTASAKSSAGNVTLTGGVYCVTLNKAKGNDDVGTAAVCYDATLKAGRWYDSVSHTAGGGWGQAGAITTSCVGPIKCKAQGTTIGTLTMTNGPNPYLILTMGNHAYWDISSLSQNLINYGGRTGEGVDITVSSAPKGRSNLFVSQQVASPGVYSRLNSTGGWGPSKDFGYHIVFPAPLYLGSDAGIILLSTSDALQTGTCTHDVGGTCGIYGVALDGTEYSFFPHFSSGALGVATDAQKANLSAYVDTAGTTWVYWGSDWLGNIGCVDGRTTSDCGANHTINRTDIFAAVLQ